MNMANPQPLQAEDYDSPWKDVLTLFFPELVAFFFPHVYEQIDWSRGFEFLDKEMQRLSAKASVGRRTVDKLVKVWLKNGKELCVLIHIEVQGQRETDFPQRIFVYQYRLFDRHKMPIASFVILTDNDPNWRPSEYRAGIFGTELVLSFPVAKLTDFRERLAELEKSDSPFAVVVQVQLAANETHGDPKGRFWRKLEISKRLYAKGFDARRVLALFEFLDGMLRLPDDMDEEFHDKLTELKEEQDMKYVTSFERIGIKKGIEQGIEQGIEKGIEIGSVGIVLRMLRNRFGSLDETLETQVRGLSLEQIESLTDALPDLAVPADLQTWLLHHPPPLAAPTANGTNNGSLELES
jgi:hypothetical protein